MVNLIATEKEMQVEKFILKAVQCFPEQFTTMIENCLDIEMDAHYLRTNLNKLVFVPKSVKCL
jgi:hypothetical protein